VYAGTASKTLAPAMRLGWLVVPQRLLEAVQRQQRQADFGVSRIEQHAFADFLSRGELDRHLRRMRVRYRAAGRAIRDEAARRGVALTPMSDYYHDRSEDSSMLLLGYARSSEALIRAGVRELAQWMTRLPLSTGQVRALSSGQI
jgi:GntR family transcriptional regulator/MocR family aminotransferase